LGGTFRISVEFTDRQKCDFGAEPKGRLFATSAGKWLSNKSTIYNKVEHSYYGI
jgi:hypothetical protein